MTNDTKVIIPFAGRRKIKYASDAVGALQEALACAKENDVVSVAIAMIDEDNEEFYLISEGAPRPALLGTLDIVKNVILDDLPEDHGTSQVIAIHLSATGRREPILYLT